MAPAMLVAHAMTVEWAGIEGGTPASINTSRAILLHVRFGATAPHTAKSGTAPPSWPSIWRTTGTDRAIASRLPSGPSTFAKGVLTPAANQICLFFMLQLNARRLAVGNGPPGSSL